MDTTNPIAVPGDPAERDLLAEVAPSPSPAPLAGTREQAVQRLQVGLSGIASMILLVGLASIVIDQAREADMQAAVVEGETVAPIATATPETPSDPLADIGVVPDLPPVEETPSTAVPSGASPSAGGTGVIDNAR